uniref:Uncharacterized protein n=1 Tax=Fagus sylvatica TaxID=28930 RepID=A0A2N9HF38_FAGSY
MTASVMVVDPKPPSEPFLCSRAQDLTYKITLRSRPLTKRPLQQAKVVEETTGVHRHPGGVHEGRAKNLKWELLRAQEEIKWRHYELSYLISLL